MVGVFLTLRATILFSLLCVGHVEENDLVWFGIVSRLVCRAGMRKVSGFAILADDSLKVACNSRRGTSQLRMRGLMDDECTHGMAFGIACMIELSVISRWSFHDGQHIVLQDTWIYQTIQAENRKYLTLSRLIKRYLIHSRQFTDHGLEKRYEKTRFG